MIINTIARLVAATALLLLAGCGDDTPKRPPTEAEQQAERAAQAAEDQAQEEAPPDGTGLDWFIVDTPWGRIPCVHAEHHVYYGESVSISCDWSQASYEPGGP